MTTLAAARQHDQPPPRDGRDRTADQSGFSLIELLVAMLLFLIITGAVFSMLGDSLRASTAAYEMTDAQESLRTAHELIARELTYTGDGMKDTSDVRMPTGFVSGWLTQDMVGAASGFVNMGVVMPDNDVTAATVPATTAGDPAFVVRPGTDRITVLERDPTFAPVTRTGGTGGTITPATATVSLSGLTPTQVAAADFDVGEIYLLRGAPGKRMFATVTAVSSSGSGSVTFASGNAADICGLNGTTAATNPLSYVTENGTVNLVIERMSIVNFFVRNATIGGTTSGLLMRRTFGVEGASFRDSVLAEHVTDLEFRYQLNERAPSVPPAVGELLPPVDQFANTSQITRVRQIEVRIETESVHAALPNNARGTTASTAYVSIRNLAF